MLLLLFRAIGGARCRYLCEVGQEDWQWQDRQACEHQRDYPPESMSSPILASAEQTLKTCKPATHEANLLRSETGCATPFYLNEEGPLSMAEVQACYERYHNLMANDRRTDNHMSPERAQHLGDLHILQQLRSHPSRVYDPDAASVHFTGLTPTLSYLIDRFDIPCHSIKRPKGPGDFESHQDRMRRAADWLRREFGQLHGDKERVYVIISSYYTTMQALGDIYHLMDSREGRRRILFGNSDLSFMRPWNDVADGDREKDLTPNHVTIPYVSNYRLDDAARSPEITCDASKRDVSFFFAGNMGRTGEGAKRADLMRTLELADPERSLMVDHRLVYQKSGPQGSNWAEGAKQYADRLLRSRFCLVPGTRARLQPPVP